MLDQFPIDIFYGHLLPKLDDAALLALSATNRASNAKLALVERVWASLAAKCRLIAYFGTRKGTIHALYLNKITLTRVIGHVDKRILFLEILSRPNGHKRFNIRPYCQTNHIGRSWPILVDIGLALAPDYTIEFHYWINGLSMIAKYINSQDLINSVKKEVPYRPQSQLNRIIRQIKEWDKALLILNNDP
jgi:hypothetical protein